ncbi:hypothetical protein ACQRCL_07970 [Limosilactobacillus reuteri]|uniref:hypothetical protein n=1 Tax=Limosilactobacillus reuteri TaxID=1598 RepID=UPI003D05F3F7
MAFRKIFQGSDESKNRIDINLVDVHHQWDFKKSQTAHVNRRNQGEQLQKDLSEEKNWIVTKFQDFNNKITNIMGNHWPKWANKKVKNWSDAEFADLKLQCQQVIQQNHPGIEVSSTMINQLVTTILTLAVQRDRMAQMFTYISYWIEKDANWKLRAKQQMQTILANLHDEEATETTQAVSTSNQSSYSQIRNFDSQVLEKMMQSHQRTNLQRYRIRSAIEKSLITPETTQTTNNHKTKKETSNELDL